MENKKPKHLLILKIIGFLCLAIAIGGFVLTIVGFGDFENNYFMLGGLMSTFGLFGGITCLMFGFRPEMAKLGTKTKKYIQEENKEDLTSIMDTSADITGGAIKKTTRAIKEGLKDFKYCKHCGVEIDKDSKFCSYCGKEQ